MVGVSAGFLRCCARFAGVACAMVFLLHLPAGASALKDSMDAYFAEMKKDYDEVAAASAVKKGALAALDRHFFVALKRHQPYYALIRTNHKGIVICEVVRGESPSHKKRNVADQTWFTQVKAVQQDYEGFLKEDNGRYYLFWARPVLGPAPKGSKGSPKFLGCVVVKVDLWDCFHKFSASVQEPYLVRLGGLSLYSHKWEDTTKYEQEPLTVPGVDRISVRLPARPAPAPTVDSAALAAPAAVAAPPTQPEQTSGGLSGLLGSKVVIGILIVAGVVIIALLIRLVILIHHYRIMRNIDKQDII